METVRLPPWRVLSTCPSLRSEENATAGTTWYLRASDTCAALNVDRVGPAAVKAAFVGANMLTSLAPSMAETSLAEDRAEVRDVKPAWLATTGADAGT